MHKSIILFLTAASAVPSEIDANGLVQLTDVAGRTFVTRRVVATIRVEVSSEEHVAQSAGALQFRLAVVFPARPAATGFLARDVRRRAIFQLVPDVLQTSAGESHRDRRVTAVHQLVVRRTEIKILFGPRRRSDVIAGASVVFPYSA